MTTVNKPGTRRLLSADIGDRVKMAKTGHKSYGKVGVVDSVTDWGSLRVKLDTPNRHGEIVFVSAAPINFEAASH